MLVNNLQYQANQDSRLIAIEETNQPDTGVPPTGDRPINEEKQTSENDSETVETQPNLLKSHEHHFNSVDPIIMNHIMREENKDEGQNAYFSETMPSNKKKVKSQPGTRLQMHPNQLLGQSSKGSTVT